MQSWVGEAAADQVVDVLVMVLRAPALKDCSKSVGNSRSSNTQYTSEVSYVCMYNTTSDAKTCKNTHV